MIEANTIVGGRYRVTKPLGGGGMKLVYLAEDLRLASRPCALAEMVDSFTDPTMQHQAVTAFQREADMLAQLSNEHIPRVFDRFSEQNRHYLVMEFIDGATLEDVLKTSGGKMDEISVVDIALQILDTLQYLHGLEPPVVYRDLKPSNVMLGRNGQVKLIDFGIARFFRPQSNATMIGTQGYAPPEQYRGRAEARSDLYALGATMHHALSGRDPAAEPPFSFPKLKTLCPNINPAIANLVDQALEYEVVHRPADALEFKERLLAIKNGVAPGNINGGTRSPHTGGKSQMRLPLGAASASTQSSQQSSPQSSPDDATVILHADNIANELRCPSCRRSIPGDSRFCSFCGKGVTAPIARNGSSTPESATTVLPGPGTRASRAEESYRFSRGPTWRPATRRDPRAMRFVLAMMVGVIFIAVVVTGLVNYFQQISRRPAEATAPEEPIAPGASIPPAYINPGPDTPEPEHDSAVTLTLREWLNMQGYQSVHFSLNGDTVILWGTVRNQFDRRWVQTQATMLTGATSIIDHMKIAPNPDLSDEP
ncbi:MAG TPA: protein kinase [Candidatus Binataceae bacterium]|nr:protein kinase [Candidatus Binataceae bacterium]